MSKLKFTDGERVLTRECSVELAEAVRILGLPSFIYDGTHTIDLMIRHPDGCQCSWAPKVAFAAADA